MPKFLSSTLSIAYLIIGLIVASSHGYIAQLHTLKPVVSAVLAVLLWPLLIVGINLHVK
jgi:hypothetical protein